MCIVDPFVGFQLLESCVGMNTLELTAYYWLCGFGRYRISRSRGSDYPSMGMTECSRGVGDLLEYKRLEDYAF